MHPNTKATKGMDRKMVLSTLWIFAVLNYIYADVFTLFFNPALQKEATQQLQSGYIGSMQITQSFVMVFAVLMETAIAMVLLSRVLTYTANRWANIGVGVLQTAAVAWSLFGGSGTNLFNIFFSAIEIACTLFIVGYAWRWPNPKEREQYESDYATTTRVAGNPSAN
jgi:hypothetical protein